MNNTYNKGMAWVTYIKHIKVLSEDQQVHHVFDGGARDAVLELGDAVPEAVHDGAAEDNWERD